jgi:hypothetical protein
MALVLGAAPGDVVDIAAEWLKVLRVERISRATLLLSTGRRVAVYADRLIEVLPSVHMRLGPDMPGSRLRLCFDAPPDIRIRRR